MYEALSSGMPLITSYNTPWINLEKSRAGINVDITKLAETSSAIQHFALMPGEIMEEWRAGALAYASSSIDKSLLKKQYENMFFG